VVVAGIINKRPRSVLSRRILLACLYDTVGNVWERLAEKVHNNYKGASTDGNVWKKGRTDWRVLRGDSWQAKEPNPCRIPLQGPLGRPQYQRRLSCRGYVDKLAPYLIIRLFPNSLYSLEGIKNMNPNKRLTIVGKFRLNDDKPKYRFTNRVNPNSEKGIYPLNPEQLFLTLQPELCFVPENTKTIGDAVFNAYKILTPLQAQQQNRPIASMQALGMKADSPFFQIETDPNVVQYHAIQKEGGRLFKELLTDLNQVARFYRGKFSKALLKLSKEYLIEYANKNNSSGVQIDQTAWYELFLSHSDLTTTILKYLTAYPEDLEKIQQQFQQDLQQATKDEPQWIDHGDEYRQALSEALIMCRQALESNDETLTEIAKQQGDMGWLVNYAGSEYDISSGFDEAAGHFAHYYLLFRKHSDNLHRFLRSGPLHSFLFCWLASKYEKHTKGNTQVEASKVAFQKGVEEQGKKRIIAESGAEWRDSIKSIREAISFDKLSDEERKKINNPSLYEAGSDALGTNLIKTLETTGNFTREQLVQQCEDLFVETALLVGGAMGDILRQFNARFDDYMVLYHAILRQQSGSPADFKEAMHKTTLKLISPPELDKITQQILTKLSGIKSCMAQTVKQAFLQVITEETQGEYFNAYLAKQDEIDATSLKLREAYRLRLAMDIDSAGNYNSSQIGIAGVATLHDIPDLTEQGNEARQAAQKATLEQEVQPKLEFKTSLQQGIGIPSGEYQIMRENVVIGSATVDDKTRENTLIMMSGQFEIDEIDTVKDAEEILAVSDEQRFTWKRTEYAEIGNALNSKADEKPVEFKEINLHQYEADAIPVAGNYNLQVDGKPVGEITINTETQKNAVSTITGTLNTDEMAVIDSDENLSLSNSEQSFDWQAKEREDLVPIVREFSGLKPNTVAGLSQQQPATEQKFDDLVGESLKDKDDLMMRLHTLVLGEYMLAAPKGDIALDTADLSKMSGLIFDMVRHIGNPKIKQLFENKPSNDLNEGLEAINLSKYYPVSKADELNTVLQYHYDVCGDLLSLRNYVGEIDELSHIFKVLRYDNSVEIQVINQTLEEHVNCTVSNNELLLCNDNIRDHHALFVYLTAQSDAQNGLASLKTLLPNDIGVLSQAGWHTQLPLFVTKDKQVKSDVFPVITSKSIALPDFSKLKLGIQGVPLLELCLSMMTTVEFGEFGEFPRKIHNDFVKLNQEVEAAGIPEKAQSISDYLKKLWFTHPTLRSQLIFLKWFNLGLQAKQGNPNLRLGDQGGFGAFLNNPSKAWNDSFNGLKTLDKNTSLAFTDFNVNMVVLFGANNKTLAAAGGNYPSINDAFSFRVDTKGNQHDWSLNGIDWKNWYMGLAGF